MLVQGRESSVASQRNREVDSDRLLREKANAMAADLAKELVSKAPIRAQSAKRIEEAEECNRLMRAELDERNNELGRKQLEYNALQAQLKLRRSVSRDSKGNATCLKRRNSGSSPRTASRERGCVVDPRPYTRNYAVTDSEATSGTNIRG